MDMFFLESQICNSYLLEKYSKLMNICPSPFYNFARGFAYVNRRFPDNTSYEISTNFREDFHRIFSKPNDLEFNDAQSALGKEILYNLGIPEGAKYVCFFARDDAYLSSILPGRDMSYHDYRNADIQNYVPMLEMLVSLGYYAIRVGSVVKKCMVTNNEKIIDYSKSKWQSDFMDIYLLANCEFFIGDTSGLKIIPMVFGKPCVVINLIHPLDAIGFSRPEDLILFKKIWSNGKRRYLTFREIIGDDCPKRVYNADENYRNIYDVFSNSVKNGLVLIENTSDEIHGIVMEMVSRIEEDIVYTKEDEDLQVKFQSLLLTGHNADYVGRLGRDYLAQNKNWLLG